MGLEGLLPEILLRGHLVPLGVTLASGQAREGGKTLLWDL